MAKHDDEVACGRCGRSFKRDFITVPKYGILCSDCRPPYTPEQQEMIEDAMHRRQMLYIPEIIVIVFCCVILGFMAKTCVTELYFH